MIIYGISKTVYMESVKTNPICRCSFALTKQPSFRYFLHPSLKRYCPSEYQRMGVSWHTVSRHILYAIYYMLYAIYICDPSRPAVENQGNSTTIRSLSTILERSPSRNLMHAPLHDTLLRDPNPKAPLSLKKTYNYLGIHRTVPSARLG